MTAYLLHAAIAVGLGLGFFGFMRGTAVAVCVLLERSALAEPGAGRGRPRLFPNQASGPQRPRPLEP
jgi:hypothetical protein